MTSISRRASLPFITLSCLLWLACTDGPIQPVGEAPPPELIPEPSFSVGGGHAGSTGIGAYQSSQMPVTDFGPWDFVHLTVSGNIEALEMLHCPERGDLGTYGPWGVAGSGNYRVEVWSSVGNLPKDPSTEFSGTKVHYGWPRAAGTVYAKRIVQLAECSKTGEYYERVTLSGSSTIEYEVFPIADVTAARLWSLPGSPIQFSAESHWDLTDIKWIFARDDTGPDPLKNNWRVNLACEGGMTCLYAPPTSGRMYITGRIFGQPVESPSPIVWAVTEPPPYCGADGAPSDPNEGPCRENPPTIDLVPQRTVLPPVMDRLFDAAAHTWSDRDIPQRKDTVTVEVRVVRASGAPVPAAAVRLWAEPVENSGFHVHPNRPVGDFFSVGEDLFKKEIVRSEIAVTTNDEGVAKAIYRSSGVSGEEILRAEATIAGETLSDDATVTIRWTGGPLVAMQREQSFLYYFSNQDPDDPENPGQRHGNINHWGHPVFIAQAQSLFTSYFSTVPGPRFTQNETRFVVTDLGLEWGGLMDVSDEPWMNAHSLHRAGRDMDLRRRTLLDGADTSKRDVLFGLCREQYPELSCKEHPSTDPNHFHLRLRELP